MLNSYEIYVLSAISVGVRFSESDFSAKPQQAVDKLATHNLIKTDLSRNNVTDKGWKYLEMLAQTPLPVQRWEDPRTDLTPPKQQG